MKKDTDRNALHDSRPGEPAFEPPTESDLPQGATAFVNALFMAHQSSREVFLPYLEKMPWLRLQFDQIHLKLKEAGMWMNDAINMVLHPDLFRPVSEDEEDSEGILPGLSFDGVEGGESRSGVEEGGFEDLEDLAKDL